MSSKLGAQFAQVMKDTGSIDQIVSWTSSDTGSHRRSASRRTHRWPPSSRLRLLLKEDHPVNHDGRVQKMHDAFLGNGGKNRHPEVIFTGRRSRLMGAALRYADGWSVGAPFVFADPEQ
jgi:hypothetical protein